MYFDLITDIAKKLDLEMSTTIVEQISGHDLDLAAKLYIYIKTDMEEYWMQWHQKYSYILERSSLRRTVGMMLNLTYRSNNYLIQFCRKCCWFRRNTRHKINKLQYRQH